MNAPSLPVDVDATATIIAEFNRQTAGSKRQSEQNRRVLADKSAVALAYSRDFKEAFYPIVAERAEGAYLHDIDGRRYLDILMGLGASLFGHNPPFIRAAIETQLAKGFPLGPQSDLAGETAELFCKLTGMDRVTFSNTGTEAVAAALRIARAATGRVRIAVFTNSYHGHADPLLGRARRIEYIRRGAIVRGASGGVLGVLRPLLQRLMFTRGEAGFPGVPQDAVRDIVYLDYGNPKSLDVLRRKATSLAAVLVEPVQSRSPELQPREFLHALREITQKSGTALIFDEMITGFRVAPGGAQEHFGVQADLATYSKIAGGGMPLSLIAGRSRWMRHVDGGELVGGEVPRDVATTFFAGTFCRHPLALAAARASASHLLEQGPALQQGLNAKTDALVQRLNQSLQADRLPVSFTAFGSQFGIATSRSRIAPKAVALLSLLLLSNGIHLRVGDRGGFLSTAHSDADIDIIHDGFVRGLRTLADFGLLTRLDGSTNT